MTRGSPSSSACRVTLLCAPFFWSSSFSTSIENTLATDSRVTCHLLLAFPSRRQRRGRRKNRAANGPQLLRIIIFLSPIELPGQGQLMAQDQCAGSQPTAGLVLVAPGLERGALALRTGKGYNIFSSANLGASTFSCIFGGSPAFPTLKLQDSGY